LDLFVPAAFLVSAQKSAPSDRADAIALARSGDEAYSGELTWEAQGGIGGRYWFASNVAVFSELMLAYRDAPEAMVASSAVLRGQTISPLGSIGAALVF
jgi:hypothetical protein